MMAGMYCTGGWDALPSRFVMVDASEGVPVGTIEFPLGRFHFFFRGV